MKDIINPKVYLKTLKNNVKNKKVISELCPECLNFDSPLIKYMSLNKDSPKYSVGDIILYDDKRPYIIQTFYEGLRNYQSINKDTKYAVALLTPSDFMLYELYINFLGFYDMGVMLGNYSVVGVEINSFLKLLRSMLNLINIT
jgi:hypothetical protein